VLFAGPDEFVGCFLFLTPGTPLAAAFSPMQQDTFFNKVANNLQQSNPSSSAQA
jgi:hypothetical protein